MEIYPYLYETHCHTSETSRCAKIAGADLARFYKSLGYRGIFVTDHFLNGNTTVPREGDWSERVGLFAQGYKNAREEGEKIGLDVFFGWEYTYFGSDFLTYGLDCGWLLAHPEVMDWSVNDYLAKARSDGAFIVHAHPFRQQGYIPMIHLLPDLIDGVETDNSAMRDDFNRRAGWYADEYRTEYHLIRSSGSDNHVGARERLAGLAFDSPIASEADFVARLREAQKGIKTYETFSRSGNPT